MFEIAVLGSSTFGKHDFDIDGHVAVGTAMAAYDGEPQSVSSSDQGDRLLLGGATVNKGGTIGLKMQLVNEMTTIFHIEVIYTYIH